jgi:AraC-like DNA-binding protein
MPGPPAGRERILPNGCVQIVINLAREYIQDCGDQASRLPASLIVGARTGYEIIDRSDMAELAGILFHPAGFAPFAGDAADLFTNGYAALEDVWGSKARRLREAMGEAPTPDAKLAAMERFLVNAFPQAGAAHPLVDFAVNHIARAPRISSVAELAARTGWSARRLSQVFREQVGLTPKQWCRIQRFQRALRRLHAGVDIAWSDLALDCGYYDQSHFANEFRAFSGIDATTYSARRTQWTNHVQV